MSYARSCDTKKHFDITCETVVFNDCDLRGTEVKSSKNIIISSPDESLTLNLLMKHYKTCASCRQGNLSYVDVNTLDDFFKSSVRCGYCGHTSSKLFNEYSVKLNFDNYLHEIYDDYCYEIDFKVLVSKSSLDEHFYLFSNWSRRTSKEMCLSNDFSFEKKPGYNVKHICCTISRFSPKKYNSTTSPIKLENHLLGEISIVVGDKIFLAHKYVLASKSDVFKAMFLCNMKESQEGLLKIDDFSAEAIEEFLKYIYTNKLENLPILSTELYKLGHKYEISCLKWKCLEFLVFDLDSEVALDLYKLASFYDLWELEEKLMSFMHNHEEEMVKLHSYKEFICENFSLPTIIDILRLCYKYNNLDAVKTKAFDFIIKNNYVVAQNQQFLSLFDSNVEIIKDLYLYEKLEKTTVQTAATTITTTK